jgi:hypothetical protein
MELDSEIGKSFKVTATHYLILASLGVLGGGVRRGEER